MPALTLKQHQLDAIEKCGYRPAFAYLMEMGTGKSLTVATEMLELRDAGEIDAVLIVAPKGSYEDWATKHLPEAGCDEHIYVWKGQGTKGERQRFDDVLERDGAIAIFNIESFSAGTRAMDAARRFVHGRRCAMIVDESTTVKSTTAKRTKNIIELGRMCTFRRILTGSIVTNSPLDVFAQFEFLQERLLGFSSFFAFRSRYAVLKTMDNGGRKFQVPVAFKNLDELREKVGRHSFRVLKSQCLDLEPKIYSQYRTEMGDKQAQIYHDVRDLAMTQLGEETYVSATSVITQLIRLHQISCGFVVDENGLYHNLCDNRLQDLLHLIEETDDSVVIWAAYRYDIKKIVDALKLKYGFDQVVEYHGGVSQNERQSGRSNFQAGTSRFFVGNVQTGGRGVDLFRSRTTVYYSNNWDLELRQQSEDRTHRMGQSAGCSYIDLVAPGTVDEKIIHALRKKINIATTINGDNYREWLI